MDKIVILNKIKNGIQLSLDEEMYYLTEILLHSKEEAKKIITIANNKNKTVLID